MGGSKRQREEYEEFLVNRPPVRMNADTQANILTMALEATRLDLEKTRMQLEDLKARQARQRSMFTADAEIARSRERIFRLVATDL